MKGAKNFENVYTTGKRKEVALTFDDDPHASTERVLDILAAHNAKATFFCQGEVVKKYPEVMKRIIGEGHIIGNHSYNHPDFTKITNEEIHSQLKRTSDDIYDVVGVKPRLFRPPFLAINANMISEILADGYCIVSSALDSKDCAGIKGPEIYNNILKNIKDGSIILCHSWSKETAFALPYIISMINYLGYKIVTVPDLLDIAAYR